MASSAAITLLIPSAMAPSAGADHEHMAAKGKDDTLTGGIRVIGHDARPALARPLAPRPFLVRNVLGS